MAVFDAKSFLKNVSTRPGVYQMFGLQEKILYIGKAANLKKRLANYFSKAKTPRIHALVDQIQRIDVIVTQSETEALLLESNLIKQHLPPYNVVLRDDKSYPYLFVSTHADYPRMDFHRGAKREKGRYFGPYPSALAVRESLKLLQKIFKVRQCQDSFFHNRTRPCLQYYIQRCTAPCVGYIQTEPYQENVRHALLFLEGKNQQVMTELMDKMESASKAMSYEQAGMYRDQITHLRKVQEKQYVSTPHGDVDVIAITMELGVACVDVANIRSGLLLGSKAHFPKIPADITAEEVLTEFLPQYYLQSSTHREIPNEIILNLKLDDQELLNEVLSSSKGKKVALYHQVRGERAQWLKLVKDNAQRSLHEFLSKQSSLYHRFEDLQKVLSLENLPQRIECFDISHTMGEATVAACVVFTPHGALKADYRRFNIKDITPGDDYAAIAQAINRRYTHLKTHEKKLPDILLIDGGKGQLHQAAMVLEELQVSGVLLVAVAKGPGRKAGLENLYILPDKLLVIKPDSKAFQLILQIRDEAHRFAITGHRQQRSKPRKVSFLEDIEGIGAKRRRELLRHFGGLQEVKRASIDELAKVHGISKELAERIYAALHGN